MLTFKTASVTEETRGVHVLAATYELVHAQSGRTGTHLKLGLVLERNPFGEITASIPDLRPTVTSDDPEVALDKLAEWLERAAAALRARGKPTPLISSYKDAK